MSANESLLIISTNNAASQPYRGFCNQCGAEVSSIHFNNRVVTGGVADPLGGTTHLQPCGHHAAVTYRRVVES